jgi:hypothetical protein
VKLFFSPDYVRSGHAFETARKSQWIVESLRREPIGGIELLGPAEGTIKTRRGDAEVTDQPVIGIPV